MDPRPVAEGLGPAGVFEVLAVRQQRRFIVLPQAAICYVTSQETVVTVYAVDGQRYYTDRTLTEVAGRLDPCRFFRLDASHIVAVARIAELIPWTHQRYRLCLADAAKTELVLSRDVGRRLRAALGW